MARGDPMSINIIMECLADFGAKSGLAVNSMKSSLYTAGILGQDLQDIHGLVNFHKGSFPFRYLGVPLAAIKLSVNHYAPFIDKVAAYINGWTNSSLSYAGRAELIRVVFQGIECFWLSILPIPAIVSDRITRRCRAFLWNSKHFSIA